MCFVVAAAAAGALADAVLRCEWNFAPSIENMKLFSKGGIVEDNGRNYATKHNSTCFSPSVFFFIHLKWAVST